MKIFKRILCFLIIVTLVLSLFSGCGDSSENTKYTMDIDFDDANKSISVEMQVDFHNNNDFTVSELYFNSFANAYREGAEYRPVPAEKEYKAYPNGMSYGDMKIKSVMDEDGNPLKFTIGGEDKNFITVETPAIKTSDDTTIIMDFEVQLANVLHRLGYDENSVYLGNFYPILAVYDDNDKPVECPYYSQGDPFYSAIADYEITLTAPSAYMIGSSGIITATEDNNTYGSVTYEGENMRDFALTMGKDFHVKKGTVNDVEVTYLYQRDSKPEENFLTIIEAIETYSKLFGDYPYPSITVSETPFIEGGMEYPAHIFVAELLTDKEKTEVIAHEIAHQWWYGVVGNNQVDFSVFDEGLAQYSTCLFYENNQKYGITRQARLSFTNSNYQEYLSVYGKMDMKLDKPIMRSLEEFKTTYDYVLNSYVRSELFFDDLRTTVGDEKFMKALQTIYSEYKFKEISFEEFCKTFETATETDLEDYIKAYLLGHAR